MIDSLFKLAQLLEKTRIQLHLQQTEKVLRRTNTDHLPLHLMERRTTNLQNLHNYWKQRQFPKNTDHKYSFVPYFVDKYNTPCAVGYLMLQTGEQKLVSKIRQTNNHIYVNDITDGPAKLWIDQSGLTKEECARIQPNYGPCGFTGCRTLGDYISAYILQTSSLLSIAFFILLEILSHKILSWVFPENKFRRLVSLGYISLGNALGALLFYLILEVYI